MADKFAAIQNFWSSFGMPAFDEYSVPSGEDAPKFPYITYSLSYDKFDRPVNMEVNLWTRSSSWGSALKKFSEIEKAVGAGKYLICEGGAVLIRFGSPIMNRLGDNGDDLIRRLLINITAEYIISK